jgi:hypothetical protein
MLSAPLDEHGFYGTGKGVGKSAGIKFLTARDAQLLKSDYAALIVRSSYQSLLEVQADLLKYLTLVFPKTTYSSQEQVFHLGGKDEPFGTIELAHMGAGPLEQVRAMNRLQGRSKSTLIVDEAGAVPTVLEFTDELMGVLRGKPEVPRRLVMFANPGGPAHSALKQRWVDPLPAPLEHMQPQRFWSDHYQRHCISLSANASVNQHLDWERYRREIEIMSHGDSEVLAALLEGRWGDLAGGSAFGAVWSPRRSRHELPADYRLSEHMPRPFVAMDWGISAPTVAYLIVPEPPGLNAPKGSLHLADELYICSSDRTGRQWHKGAMLSNAEQAALLVDWLERWGLSHRQLRLYADDAIFARNGSPTGSVAGDFKQAGVRLEPANKANCSTEAGLGKLKSRLAATRTDHTAPWLTWSARCPGWEATVPSLSRDPNHPERLGPGQPDHAADAARYGICLADAKWACGGTNYRIW